MLYGTACLPHLGALGQASPCGHSHHFKVASAPVSFGAVGVEAVPASLLEPSRSDLEPVRKFLGFGVGKDLVWFSDAMVTSLRVEVIVDFR